MRRFDGHPSSEESNRRQLDRIGAFSDGVFAVAITLLVLNIEVPDVSTADFGQALQDLLPSLQAYFIAFFVIGLFWYGHHLAWSQFTGASARLVWANMLLLMLIALMPFTTALIGRFGDLPLATAAYAFNVGLAAIADSLVDRVARSDNLVKPMAPAAARAQSVAGFLRPAVFFLSIPIAWISVTLAQCSWLLLLVIHPITRQMTGTGADDQEISP